MKRFYPFVIAFQFLFLTHISGQTPPKEWSQLSPQDLKMTQYDKDTSANAVILVDYGVIRVQDGGSRYESILERHKRIKILDKSAFEYGDVEIPFYAKSERINQLKIRSIAPNGKVTEVSKNNVFEGDYNEHWKNLRFSFPNLEVGSILEYSYTLTSDYIIQLQDWYFQSELPILHSEIQLDVPPAFEYVYLFNGSSEIQAQIQEQNTASKNNRTGIYTYFVKDAPAIVEESFITTMEDYKARFRFQLSRTMLPGDFERPYLSDWDHVSRELLDMDRFGKIYTNQKGSKKTWAKIESIINGLKSEKEKAKFLYDYVCSQLSWDGYNGMLSARKVDELMEDGKADSGEFNLALIALLRRAGIAASPVLISTRSHGVTQVQYPIVDQFNHVIVEATIDGVTTLLDAGSSFRPMGLLRVESLNERGWTIVDKNEHHWVKIQPSKAAEVYFATLELTEEGDLSGQLKIQYKGYDAVSARRKYAEKKEAYWEEWLTARYPDAEVEEIESKNVDALEKPFQIQMKVKLNNSKLVGDFIYLNPIIYSFYEKNPFKLEKRNYPVDIPYPIKEQLIVNLIVPDGYTVDALPDPINVVFENGKGKFRYLAKVEGQQVQITSLIDLQQIQFLPSEYPIVKGLFDRVAEAYGEQIVLKKVE